MVKGLLLAGLGALTPENSFWAASLEGSRMCRRTSVLLKLQGGFFFFFFWKGPDEGREGELERALWLGHSYWLCH